MQKPEYIAVNVGKKKQKVIDKSAISQDSPPALK